MAIVAVVRRILRDAGNLCDCGSGLKDTECCHG